MENEFNTSHPFTEAGFSDLNTAVEMFDSLGIDSANLKTVDTLKLKAIAEFVESFEDGLSAAQSVLRKRQNSDISPVDYLHGYIHLYKQKHALQGKLDEIDKELSFYR